MILLDTNVISELWRPAPSRLVEQWMDSRPSSTLFISSISLGELTFGAMRLADGQRRDHFVRAIQALEQKSFAGRILAFDRYCVAAYGQIRAEREKMGRPTLAADGFIAAIARTHGLSLATRNIRDFEEIGIDLINPFEAVV